MRRTYPGRTKMSRLSCLLQLPKPTSRRMLLITSSTGGAEGDRTPDLVIANDALSHLSYGPRSVRAHRHGLPTGYGPLSEEGTPLKGKFREAPIRAWPASMRVPATLAGSAATLRLRVAGDRVRHILHSRPKGPA